MAEFLHLREITECFERPPPPPPPFGGVYSRGTFTIKISKKGGAFNRSNTVYVIVIDKCFGFRKPPFHMYKPVDRLHL